MSLPIMKNNREAEYRIVYNKWYASHPAILQTETEAIRELLPDRKDLQGIKVICGPRKSVPDPGSIKSFESSQAMRSIAIEYKIEGVNYYGKKLSFANGQWDFVLLSFYPGRADDFRKIFKESFRILKNNGVMILSFMDCNNPIVKQDKLNHPCNVRFGYENHYNIDRILMALSKAGFNQFQFRQTLFSALATIKEFQPCKAGYGEGAFVVIRASKNFTGNNNHQGC